MRINMATCNIKKCVYISYDIYFFKTMGPVYNKKVQNSVDFQCFISKRDLGFLAKSLGVIH